MSSGKSGGKARVTEYFMSMHFGVCSYVPGVSLQEIKVGDITAWSGSVTAAQALTIDNPNLFGGNQKEGGLNGVAWWLPGDPNQQLPDPLAGRLGLAYDNCPGFRGLASIFFTGVRYDGGADLSKTGSITNVAGNYPVSNTSGQKGFMWVMNNPYLKSIAIRVQRDSCPLGLNATYASIYDGATYVGTNPAYMVAEALTNTVWGMGEDAALVDTASFQAAAITLYNEKFGLNMLWSRQSTIEQFVQEVLDHVHATLYVDPTTGLHTFKLLRADYDVNTLPIISPSNATLSSFKRKLWGEVSNEVTVTYTNPINGKNLSVTAQDLAAISMQGGINPTSKNYYGITYDPLAATVAQRDVAMLGRPIATAKVKVSRELWDLFSGGVAILQWPARGIGSVVVRISNVTKSAHNVSFDIYEDIFGLSLANYISSVGSQWSEGNTTPTALTNYQIGTMPAFLMTAALGVSDPSAFSHPEAMSAITIGPNSDVDTGYQLETYTTNAAGQSVLSNIGTKLLQGTWTLAVALPAEATTKLTSLTGLIGSYPDVGEFVLIGDGTDDTTEICLVTARDATGWTLARGVLDTVPKPWAAGSRAYRIPTPAPVPDATVRSVGETAKYKFLTQTTSATLAEANAPDVSITLTERPYLPLRPANVQLDGIAFGTVGYGAATSKTLTWANRNRELEVTQAYLWTDADMTPETGQTTRVTVSTASGDQVFSGLTGTSYDIPLSAFSGNSTGTVKVEAELGGNVSLQGYSIPVTIP